MNHNEDHVHLFKTLNAFYHYKDYMTRKMEQLWANYRGLSEKHRSYLPNYEKYLSSVSESIQVNHDVLKNILSGSNDFVCKYLEGRVEGGKGLIEKISLHKASDYGLSRVASVLRHIVRDWGVGGAAERSSCYAPIIRAVTEYFPPDSSTKVLVPGAGLGRLAWELASLGYTCEGNEQALEMILTSQYILNCLSEEESIAFYPWAGNFCNRRRNEDQVEPVLFPDVSPRSGNVTNFSMSAGDFLQIYTEREQWDCVVTCFFIDTAHNILDYVDKIFDILVPGGIWVNLGPLLYHYSETNHVIELSYEDIKNVILGLFTLQVEDTEVSTMYIYESTSMMNYTYKSVLFVARK